MSSQEFYYNLIHDLNLLKIYKVPYIIGGSTALFLHGYYNKIPHDIDLFLPITKEEFYKYIYMIIILISLNLI